ncbi:MAG: radical SAM protein [Rubrivivax sp.]|nr:radical SAM protein [Rubrivivax sp.]
MFLTTACNLRCSYCYAAAGDAPARFMPLSVARRGIDFVAKNASNKGLPRFEVAFHGGGEPTVNWKTMVGAADYARSQADRLGLSVGLGAASNGVLNETQIEWMVEHLQGVSLSFDGLPDSHDRHRPLIGGAASSGRVMHTMRRFDEASFAYAVRMTVTEDQIQNLPASIAYLCENFRVQSIQVEPAYQLGRWSNAPVAETIEFIDAFRKARRHAVAAGRTLSFSAARLDTLTNHFCGVSQDNFCLTPDGNVSACYEVFSEQSQRAAVFIYGHPLADAEGYSFDESRLRTLRGLAVEHRTHCHGCFAKWHCAGDCHHKALAEDAGVEFAGSNRCHITRELMKDQLLDRIAASGGIFWHEQLRAESASSA